MNGLSPTNPISQRMVGKLEGFVWTVSTWLPAALGRYRELDFGASLVYDILPKWLIVARHSFHGLSFVTLISCSASGLEQNLPSLVCLLKAEVDLATTGLPHLYVGGPFSGMDIANTKAGA
jgi:hypothetical protein